MCAFNYRCLALLTFWFKNENVQEIDRMINFLSYNKK